VTVNHLSASDWERLQDTVAKIFSDLPRTRAEVLGSAADIHTAFLKWLLRDNLRYNAQCAANDRHYATACVDGEVPEV
jgi:hypothetical protein